MKAFVYIKNGSQLFQVITNVEKVTEEKDSIRFETKDGFDAVFSKKIYKTKRIRIERRKAMIYKKRYYLEDDWNEVSYEEALNTVLTIYKDNELTRSMLTIGNYIPCRYAEIRVFTDGENGKMRMTSMPGLCCLIPDWINPDEVLKERKSNMEKLSIYSVYFTGSRKNYKRCIRTDGAKYYVQWYRELIEVAKDNHGWYTVDPY